VCQSGKRVFIDSASLSEVSASHRERLNSTGGTQGRGIEFEPFFRHVCLCSLRPPGVEVNAHESTFYYIFIF